jgi:hypothetical protein
MTTFFRRCPVSIVLIPLTLFFAVLVNAHYMPIHDTLSHYMRIYAFLNHFAVTGKLPLWFPYLDWGTPTASHFLISMSSSLLFLAPWLKIFPHWNALAICFASFFIDNVILLAGVYGLSKLVFKKTTTALFVSFLIVGPVVEMEQCFFSFYIFYNIPICMYFLLKGIEEKQKKLILAGFTIFLITGCYCIYTFLLQGVCLGLFFLACLWERGVHLKKFQLFSWSRYDLLMGFFLILGLVAPLILLHFSTHLQFTTGGRLADGSTLYTTFLYYGWAPDYSYFSGLIGGDSFPRNVISYGGIFIFPFAVLALIFAPSRKQVPFLIVAAFLFLLWAGPESFVAPIMYHVPGFSMYRQLGMVTPVLKVFLVFVAGFGFDRWATDIRVALWGRRLLDLSLFLLVILGIAHYSPLYAERDLSVRGILVEVIYLCGGILLASSILNPRIRRIAPALLVVLVAIDVFSFRSYMYHARLVQIPEFLYQDFAERPIEFYRSRVINYFDAPHFSDLSSFSFFRYSDRDKFQKCLETGTGCPMNRGADAFGAYSNEMEPFLGFDPCHSVIRSDLVLPHVVDVQKKFGLPIGLKQPITALPILNSGFRKLAACDSDKFQIADEAKGFKNDAEALDFLGSSAFKGQLLVEGENSQKSLGDYSVNAGEKFKIQNYDYNSLRGQLNLPDDGKSRWLFISEAWDSHWKARINGIVSPLLRANVAFRALKVPPGRSSIEFEYEDPITTFLFYGLWLLSFGCVATLLVWFVREFLIPQTFATRGKYSELKMMAGQKRRR